MSDWNSTIARKDDVREQIPDEPADGPQRKRLRDVEQQHDEQPSRSPSAWRACRG